eukprot:TRINITY_DN1876_c1_g1_i2.p1 TRINITY_DN1876_c1_g1~~TRINITY_DN1876_c1_g1_i2.p1  ORF type:complete len:1315 (-),score=354.21 TRINITY_DN1876_c1_g1_i2:100-3675(-)
MKSDVRKYAIEDGVYNTINYNDKRQDVQENEEGGYKPIDENYMDKDMIENKEGGYKPIDENYKEIVDENEEGGYKPLDFKDKDKREDPGRRESMDGYFNLMVDSEELKDLDFKDSNETEEDSINRSYTMLDTDLDDLLEISGYTTDVKVRRQFTESDLKQKGYLKKKVPNLYDNSNKEIKIDNNHAFFKRESSNVENIKIIIDKRVDTTLKLPTLVNKALDQFHECLKVLRDSSTRTYEIRMRTYNQISTIMNDFLHDSEQYGKIIIKEIGLPIEEKTIKPINKGGILGGEKFVVGNILFKFAIDKNNLFNGNTNASQKVAGHELKCLSQVSSLNMEGLRYPLMCLIDYLGHRLIAMSILPIQGSSERKSTLVYGTQDGGKNYTFSDPVAKKFADAIGKKLNLKKHKINSSNNNIYTPADIEIHKGYDGNYYILDFSRLLPCDYIDKKKQGSIFYRMFRPEFVSNYKIPLCSDSFSGFLDISQLPTCNNEIKFAHKFLNEIILKFSQKLSQEVIPVFSKHKKYTNVEISKSLTERMHSEGINIRYAGRVRYQCENDRWNSYLMLEMVGRTIKRQAKEYFRLELSKKVKSYGIGCCLNRFVDYFNLVFGCSEHSEEYWQKGICSQIEEYFEFCFIPNEKENAMKQHTNPQSQNWFRSYIISLKRNVGEHPFSFLIKFISRSLSLVWNRCTWDSLTNQNTLFNTFEPIDSTDIIDIEVCVKHLPIAPFSSGKFKQLKAMYADKELEFELHRQSVHLFSKALSSNPCLLKILRNLAIAHLFIDHEYESLSFFSRALDLYPLSASTVFKYAMFLDKQLSSNQVELNYIRSIQIKPLKYKFICTYADWLLLRQKYEYSKTLYQIASKMKEERHEAFNNLACVHILTEQYDEAIKILEKSLIFCQSSLKKHSLMKHKSDKDYERGILVIYHNLFVAYCKKIQKINKNTDNNNKNDNKNNENNIENNNKNNENNNENNNNINNDNNVVQINDTNLEMARKYYLLSKSLKQRQMSTKCIHIATSSTYKLKEIKKVVGKKFFWKIKHAHLDLNDNEEDDTLEICKKKINLAFSIIKNNCLVETPYIKVYEDNSDTPILQLTGNKFKSIGFEKFSETYSGKKSSIGVYVAYKEAQTEKIFIYEGFINGIITKKSGLTGFGWDYIFKANGFDKTISELEQYRHLLNFRREPYLKFTINHLQN